MDVKIDYKLFETRRKWLATVARMEHHLVMQVMTVSEVHGLSELDTMTALAYELFQRLVVTEERMNKYALRHLPEPILLDKRAQTGHEEGGE